MKALTTLLFFTLGYFVNAQDKIKLKTGEVVKCRVYKIANGKVAYKKMHNLKGPDLFYAKGDIEYIKYENGKVLFMSGNKMKKPAVKKAVKKK
ncbi:MAG: hypothetical protein JWO32_2817 [Bacteroidetes bacterium]|nr:hypothetical protein [Bacteroidota bacterium]